MKRIREIRILRRKTQLEIAQLLCINRTTYTKWENGTHAPDISSLQRLASILKTTVAYLLEETDDASADQKEKPVTISADELSNLDQNLFNLLVSLTPYEADQARAYVQGLKDARK